MPHSYHHHRQPPASKQLLRTFVILLAITVIAGAGWIITAAVLENMHFAAGTDQMLKLVSAAHNLAGRDKNFAMQPNEDLIFDMMRIGIITDYSSGKPVSLINPWDGRITSLSPAPSSMRIETDVPNHDCRRMALFFVRNGKDLGLKIIEVRGEGGQAWQRFYSPADGINIANNKAIEDACDRSPRVTLAFVLTVR